MINFAFLENADDEIKLLVMKQCEDYLKTLPKELHDTLERQLPNQQKSAGEFTVNKC